MIEDVLIPLITIGLAELGDKSQLSILLLSSKTKKHLQLLIGVILAFLLLDGIAVTAGFYIKDFLPMQGIKIVSGAIFIILGIITLTSRNKQETKKSLFKHPFLLGFGIIFMTEWGDKTQIAAGLFATKYNPIMVLIGTIISLTLFSIVAIFLGKFISEKVDRRKISIVARILFILIGLSFFYLEI